MLYKFLNGFAHPDYGVPHPAYGIPGNPDGGFLRYLLLFVFFALIPLILLAGVFAFAKRLQFSKRVKVCIITVVMAVYYAVLIGAIVMAVYLFV